MPFNIFNRMKLNFHKIEFFFFGCPLIVSSSTMQWNGSQVFFKNKNKMNDHLKINFQCVCKKEREKKILIKQVKVLKENISKIIIIKVKVMIKGKVNVLFHIQLG